MGVYLAKKDPDIGSEGLPGDGVPEFMRWGLRLQEPILAGYAEQTGNRVTPADPYTVFTTDRYPFLGATLDATRNDDACPVEVKNVGFKSAEWGDDGTDQIPERFYVQIMVQMMVTGAREADLAVLFGGRKLSVYTVEFDEEVAAGLYDAARTFWEKHVVADVPPDVDSSQAWSSYLAARPQTNNVIVPADAGLSVYASRLSRARRLMAKLKDVEAEAKNIIVKAIGENAGIAREGEWQATYRQAKSTVEVDWETVAQRLADEAQCPETLRQLTQECRILKVGSRRFLFTTKNKKET
jgi:predicted phage-related endonuclease